MNNFEKGISAWFIFCVLFILVVWGVGIWAVIELVQWVKSQ